LPNHIKLREFLLEECRKRGLSLRRLSINAGLSPATVHNILKRQYQPTLFSLNRLADYLGVKREYLWQLAGLLEDMDYTDTTFSDPELRFHFARADKLPRAARKLIISLIEAIIIFLETRAP
jgi:lambda repressor-like predicted transcriptional regulator